jgi:hypothetical protein
VEDMKACSGLALKMLRRPSQSRVDRPALCGVS